MSRDEGFRAGFAHAHMLHKQGLLDRTMKAFPETPNAHPCVLDWMGRAYDGEPVRENDKPVWIVARVLAEDA